MSLNLQSPESQLDPNQQVEQGIQNPNTPVPPTEDPYLVELRKQNQLLMQQMGMMSQQIQAIGQNQNQNQTPAPAPTPEISYEDLVNNPGQVLQQHINRAIAPMNTVIQQMSRQSNYQNQIRPLAANHPQVAGVWNQISSAVDQHIIANILPQRDATPQDLEFAVMSALGRLSLNGQNTQPNNPPPQNTQITPPSVRPNGAPLPNQVPNQFKPRPLTELEARVARENRMTPLQYLYYNGEITLEQAKQSDPNFKA